MFTEDIAHEEHEDRMAEAMEQAMADDPAREYGEDPRDAMYDAMAAAYDDDPDPYAGTYSEM